MIAASATSNAPWITYAVLNPLLAPTCREEYMAMLEWGIRQTEHPVAIRVPANGVVRFWAALTQ